ncbi:MAG: response regulator [Planctomycetota bacterium]|jgi:CheY-like chemotaxis protein
MAENVKTVLVVDDDPDARDFLATVLRDNGFIATMARDGVEAIAMIEEQKPDLVALDISMPEKSGVAVYRKLKEDEQLRGIPVIIVTGISDDFKKFISTRRQVPPPEGYIHKPVDHEEFLRMVRDFLG